MPEKTTAELLDEYYKKHPEKRPLMRRLADQRKANTREKANFNAIYKEEFDKQRGKSLKARARQEAIDKYRPTRKQKMSSFADAIGNLGGIGTTTQQQRRKSSSKKKQKGKQKFTVIGGKAYPIAKQPHQQSKTHHKKKKRRTSNDPFDLGGLDNIGDFDF